MFFAMMAAAGLLAVWMICRGGLKMKTTNVVILIAVLAIVAGVAWFRSAREGSTAGTPPTPAKEGELCPDPPPTAKVDGQATSGPATPASGPAVAKKMPRVIDLGADKCKACKELAPILEQLRKEYEGRVTVEFIDVWKNPKAGEPYKISVIPTQVFFDAEGKEVWRHVGFLPKADFVAKFAELGVK
jgi:thioredoxin 1